MITTQIRDAMFEMVEKTQALHLEICEFLVSPNEEREEKIEIMIREAKELMNYI